MDCTAHSVSSGQNSTAIKRLKRSSSLERLEGYYKSKTPIASSVSPALKFEIYAKCSTTKARVSLMHLPHYSAQTPMFMPVGTLGTMKGLTTEQLEELDCHVILGNTYHLVSIFLIFPYSL